MCFCVGMCECAVGLLGRARDARVYWLYYVVKYAEQNVICDDDEAPLAPIINFCTDSTISRGVESTNSDI